MLIEGYGFNGVAKAFKKQWTGVGKGQRSVFNMCFLHQRRRWRRARTGSTKMVEGKGREMSQFLRSSINNVQDFKIEHFTLTLLI